MTFAFLTFVATDTVSCASSSPSTRGPEQAAPAHATPERPSMPDALRLAAGAGVDSPSLRAFLERKLEGDHEENPLMATLRGDHRFDGDLMDVSAAAHARRMARGRALLDEVRALKREELSRDDRTTLALAERDLQVSLDLEVCEGWLWQLSTEDNALVLASGVLQRLELRTEQNRSDFLARLRKLPRTFDALHSNLETGARRGLAASRGSVLRVLAMLDRELAKPAASWGALERLEKLPDDLSDVERTKLRATATAIVENDLRPAAVRYRDALRQTVLARARPDDRPGLVSLPNGAACYQAYVTMFTTQNRNAEELHRLGLEHVALANGRMRELGAKLFGTNDLGAITNRLRTDGSLYFGSAEEIESTARGALERARRALPSAFETIPKTPCEVVPIPAFQAPYSPIAYYGMASLGSSEPARYWVNTFAPTTRPRYEAEALAFHESIPGHHLQLARSQEQRALPLFRRTDTVTAFVEGWGLYAERLADDMGLYSSDLDRMGMLSFDAWRASRLVVDTGLHALGWSRERAIRFMTEHTALTPGNIENEIDRYIGLPGQALAYKVGQLELLRLRAWAQAELGARFDLKAFHEAVLSRGAVPLGLVEAQVREHVSRVRSLVPSSAP